MLEGYGEGLALEAKLRTEAPVNGGRNYNGQLGRCKTWLYAGISEYLAVLVHFLLCLISEALWRYEQ